MDKATRRTRISHSSLRTGDAEGVHVAKSALKSGEGRLRGRLLEIAGDQVYCITHVDRMQPFLVALASPSDHWMFLSSTGALTAGRRSSEGALFPYVTDDKLHDAASHTGPKTLILVERQHQTLLWEPFTDRYEGLYRITRILRKGSMGNRITFEEINHDLSLRFEYSWQIAPSFGFVRQARLESLWKFPIRVRVLDGLQNVLPPGVPTALQDTRSTLVDGYKISEIEQGIGLFRLSSLIVDRPEPAEALLANTVWSIGPSARPQVTPKNILLSSRQLSLFRQGQVIQSEHIQRAVRGAFFTEYTWRINPEKSVDWSLIANVEQGVGDVARLLEQIKDRAALRTDLLLDLRKGDRELRAIVAAADGHQYTSDRTHDQRHGLNTLYNIQRGGIPVDRIHVRKSDLLAFVRTRNRTLTDKPFWDQMPAQCDLDKLPSCDDPQLNRLLAEYMPLGYGRRHGDPSRPWNRFNIELHDENGHLRLHYEGNWRDVFQNWEALACSYPLLLPRMIAVFVNASTADGYNPYRISRSGIDWEVPDPNDPWSHIGYWGDHQIVYLLRLLEQAEAYYPGMLATILSERAYAYANVPYRLGSLDETLADSHCGIRFDTALNDQIRKHVQDIGSDGCLLPDAEGQPVLVTLAEKLLVPVLAKLSNFVPGAGIWMNTDRPEWNDALNGMPGRGCSMITLQHLHAHLQLLGRLFKSRDTQSIAISGAVAKLITRTGDALSALNPTQAAIDPAARKSALEELGRAGTEYRRTLYQEGLSGPPTQVGFDELTRFAEAARRAITPTLRGARTDSGLHHAYFWMTPMADSTLAISPNLLMLEGQVAALESGLLTGTEAAELLDTLRKSALWSKAQQSFLLYPDQPPKRFMSLNSIGANHLVRCSLVRKMIAAGDGRLIGRNPTGDYYFHHALINEKRLEQLLDELKLDGYAKAVNRDRIRILTLYRELFGQDKFNGRATRFFKYEGLGCVYWHMVSKLMLAVQRVFWKAKEADESAAVLAALARHYYFIRKGLGYDWDPGQFGAFPVDPHSHSSSDTRARQPGLTGRVKEDLLARWGELGVRVAEGRITFDPALLRKSEFLARLGLLRTFDWAQEEAIIELKPGSLGFTLCQVPIIYTLTDAPRLTLLRAGEGTLTRGALTLTRPESKAIFGRTGSIRRIEVGIQPGLPS
ncbi:MAG: hypothetical protein OXU68_08265 [Bacteroidota bacterium]|nr:hypothetical protein [Bacteroidota bacterium]